MFRTAINFYKSLDKKKRVYFIISILSALAAMLLYIFEPFSPFHSPFVFIFAALAMVCIMILFRKRLMPVLAVAGTWVKAHKRLTVTAGIIVAVIYAVFIFTPLGRSPFSGLSEEELREKIDTDYEVVKTSIFQMDTVLRGLRANEHILKVDDIRDLNQNDRAKILKLWKNFMSHMICYDNLIRDYRYFYRIFYFKHKFLHNKAFLIGYTAFVTRYLCGSEVLSLVHNNPVWETILDEPDRDLGILEGSYSNLKYNVIHVNDVLRLTAGYAHLQFLKPGLGEGGFLERQGEIFDYIDRCFLKSTKLLAKKSVVWFPQNGIDIFKRRTFAVWFPVQKIAASSTGHLRFTRRRENYIKKEHIEKLDALLRPGDILLERRNWYLSNVGIPGFWPHAALYLGTRDKFLAFFSQDEEIVAMVGQGGIEGYLYEKYPRLWQEFTDDMSVIESIEPGVVLNTLEKSAGADYTAAMRPVLSKRDMFLALCCSFSHYKKPYDYNFDFITDSALVCTELVFKSYQRSEEKAGISFPLIRHAGRDLCTAQVMVKMFDEQYDTDKRQLDFVCFLDYDDNTQAVKWATLDAFRKSWKRPKWSVLLE